MTKEVKELVEPSVVVFGYLLQEQILDGWRISEQYPVNLYGGLYIATLERHVNADKKEEEVEAKVSETVETVNEVSTSDEEVVTQEVTSVVEAPKRGPKPKQGK